MTDKQEKFISKCIAKHGDRYDYSETVYNGSTQQIDVICRLHGKFSQLACNHTQGHGCKHCSRINTVESLKSNTPDFKKRASAAHNNFYDYSRSVYTRMKSKLIIICPTHGEFEQMAESHLNGKGCKLCNSNYKEAGTTKGFIESARIKHNNFYDYSLVEYIRSKDKVKIICPVHGVFEQQPVNHLFGQGCRSCAKSGFDPSKTGILYILKYQDITKVGITNLKASTRCKEISKSFGANFEIVSFIKFEDGSIPDKVETDLLRELRELYDRPTKKFEGSTEAFLNVDYHDLLLRITNLVGKHLQTN